MGAAGLRHELISSVATGARKGCRASTAADYRRKITSPFKLSSKLKQPRRSNLFLGMLPSLRPLLLLPLHLPFLGFRCKCSSDISSFRETFARRMAMAGIKPHHKIAMGVSGGPDSMALCVLMAGWKSDEGHGVRGGPSGYIDGLLCIIVDHGLRPESAEEARVVQERVVKMGIKCEIQSCNWPEGRPKLGHLQEAAREMRYQIFHGVCVHHQIGVLLVAHHADDQAELFILRLSRNSGVLGLAGMAFVSQLFLAHASHCSSSSSHGILLVRPMLEFSKDDMYEVCRCSLQTWVEDPTNQCTLFARNRIRNALRSMFSSLFWWEVQGLVSACRLTRIFTENICRKMLKHSVTIMDEGYSIIDLEKLDPSNINDLCLSRFLVMILQFISQRQRPIRGSVMRQLLDYFRNVPCKTSLTAAGCYLCTAPRTKGTKIIVCYSPQSPFPSKMFLSTMYHEERPLSFVIDGIIRDAKLHSDKLVSEASCIPFLHAKSSESILKEALQLKLISQSTYISIGSLQMEEHENFCSKNGVEQAYNLGHQRKVASCSNVQLYPGESCHFMCRFVIAWKVYQRIHGISSDFNEFKDKSEPDGEGTCQFCINSQKHPLTIRHMVDADWQYLAKLSDSHSVKDDRTETIASICEIGQQEAMELWSCSYVKSSAQAALHHLKYVPAAARRGLPVLVNSQDVPLCIPSIGFRICPCLSIVTEFRPRVPLGGGYSSYL